jgi:hypothetical protein
VATTPLRALRVPDPLWRAAQARAAACGETVSEVVRRGLAEYVALGELEGLAHGSTRSGTASVPTTQPDAQAVVLLAQGMIMYRLGLDAETAASHLRGLAETWEVDLEEAARSVVAAPVAPGLLDQA